MENVEAGTEAAKLPRLLGYVRYVPNGSYRGPPAGFWGMLYNAFQAFCNAYFRLAFQSLPPPILGRQ